MGCDGEGTDPVGGRSLHVGLRRHLSPSRCRTDCVQPCWGVHLLAVCWCGSLGVVPTLATVRTRAIISYGGTGESMMGILVTHPGRQHSHQLAHALHEQNALFAYWTGVPSASASERGPLYRRFARIRHCYVEPLVRRIVDALCTPPQAIVSQHRAMEWFDRWCAWQLPDNLDAVVCYENAALHTFRAAHERGIPTILDAASFHHEWQDAVYDPVESEEAHARITAHKDREIRLADLVLTVSELACNSYVEAGVPEKKVVTVPMGVDESRFATPSGTKSSARSEPFTFLLVGHADQRKGADILLKASRRLYTDGANHRVQVAGRVDEGIFSGGASTIEPLGYLNAERLEKAYKQADVLVLPSRFDSFGRVVVEAMAAGLPALVSEHVGAKQVLT
ncbi:hypothetical protein BRC21_01015, partial [Candidatus Saccharibacteria bacterium SW_7_54_9]